MDTIFVKISVSKSDFETEKIREQGLLFHNIADAIGLDRNAIVEVDETNCNRVIKQIKQKYYDKSRSHKKST